MACQYIRQHRQQILPYILLFLHTINFSIIVLSLSMSLGLSGLKADIGKIGRIRSLQVTLIFNPPVPHDAPPTRMNSDFWITGSCLSYNAV